jgi:phage gpG-like protein
MPSDNVKIDFNIDGLERIRKNLEESKLTAKLGIFGDKNKRDDKTGTTNAYIGALHEFGVLTKELPRRSFLLDPLTIKGKELTKETGKIIDKYIDEEGGIEKILELVGIYGESIVQEAFESGGFGAWQPIKEATTNKKGSSQILIDSSELRRSVISKVEKRDN